MDLVSILVGVSIFFFGILVGHSLSSNDCCSCCDDEDNTSDINVEVDRTCGPKCKCRE